MTTKSFNSSDVERRWFVVDANEKVLGRLATRVATMLRGKHKPQYTPHADVGDFVIVVNAEKVRLTGKKDSDKLYRHHTGWVGGLVSHAAKQVREQDPERLIKDAIKGMLPRGTLGREMFSKLKVYAGGDHPHAAQKPEVLAL